MQGTPLRYEGERTFELNEAQYAWLRDWTLEIDAKGAMTQVEQKRMEVLSREEVRRMLGVCGTHGRGHTCSRESVSPSRGAVGPDEHMT